MRIVHLYKGGSTLDGIAVSMMAYIEATPHHRHEVFTVTHSPYLAEETLRVGAKLHDFQPRGFLSVDWNKVDVIFAWGHAGNAMSRLTRVWCNAPIVWSLRDTGTADALVAACVSFNRRASFCVPAAIMCVAESTMRHYSAKGYAASKFVHIPNGVDINRFTFDAWARNEQRKLLGIGKYAPVIGMAARYSKEKGFDLFLEAAQAIRQQFDEAHFIVCGSGTMSRVWKEDVARAGLEGIVHSRGEVRDMPVFYSALDALLLPARAVDAQNRSLLEALACGIPCIATNIGDAKEIIGECGAIVPAEPLAITEAFRQFWQQGLTERDALATACRARINDHYSVRQMAFHIDQLLARVIEKH